MQTFFEMQCLVHDLVDFLGLLMFINAYLKYSIWWLNILLDEVDRGLR